jgi:hypothetical protein
VLHVIGHIPRLVPEPDEGSRYAGLIAHRGISRPRLLAARKLAERELANELRSTRFVFLESWRELIHLSEAPPVTVVRTAAETVRGTLDRPELTPMPHALRLR